MESVHADWQVYVCTRALTQARPGLGQATVKFLHLGTTHRDPQRRTNSSSVAAENTCGRARKATPRHGGGGVMPVHARGPHTSSGNGRTLPPRAG